MNKLMLLSNPFENPLFLPAVYHLGVLLGLGLCILLIRRQGRLQEPGDEVLFERWKTWLIIAPTYVLAILGGHVTTAVLIAFVSFQATKEYAFLVQLPPKYRSVLLTFSLIPAPVALLEITGFYFLPPLLLVMSTLQPLIFGEVRQGVRHLAFAVLGWAYIPWLLAHAILIHRRVTDGSGILIALGTAVACSDVGAFVVGTSFGKHKMAPRVSPNKTYEGAVGNLLGACLGFALMHFALPDEMRRSVIVTLPLVIALGAIWGDLVESVIKREFGAKDAGTGLPGFGGLLDRVDSFILVTPLVYYFLILI